MVLPDDPLFVTDLSTNGPSNADASNESPRCLRVRIRSDKSGIDLLPAPNR